MQTKFCDRKDLSAEGSSQKRRDRVRRDRVGEAMDWLMENHRWAAYTLAAVALPALAAVAMTAPNVIPAVDRLSRLSRANRDHLAKARARLIAKGYLKLSPPGPGVRHYILTSKGKRQLAEIMVGTPRKKRRRRWDRKWRVLLYDVPEKRRLYRERMRAAVRAFGCYQLQKNVWLYPYQDIEELAKALHLIYGKGKAAIVCLTTSRFAGDIEAGEYFGLSKE